MHDWVINPELLLLIAIKFMNGQLVLFGISLNIALPELLSILAHSTDAISPLPTLHFYTPFSIFCGSNSSCCSDDSALNFEDFVLPFLNIAAYDFIAG